MGDGVASPEDPGGQHSDEPEDTDSAREAAMMRAVMRAQEKHREGGVDPELEDTNPRPDS